MDSSQVHVELTNNGSSSSAIVSSSSQSGLIQETRTDSIGQEQKQDHHSEGNLPPSYPIDCLNISEPPMYPNCSTLVDGAHSPPGYPMEVDQNSSITPIVLVNTNEPTSPEVIPTNDSSSLSHQQEDHDSHNQESPVLQGISTPIEYKNLLPDVLNDTLVKNIIFSTNGNIIIKVFSFLVNTFILLGLGEALMINYVTRREVKNMRIGNRMLNYKSRGNIKMTLLCITNWIMNIFSFGLFYILGFSHEFYLSQLDERIYWGKPAKVSKKRNQQLKDAVCWRPEDNGLGDFKIYSVYLGVFNEAMYLFLSLTSVISFGFLTPLLYQFYYPKYFEKVEVGNGGRFTVIHPTMIPSINKHASKRSKLKKEKIEIATEIYPSEFPVLGFPPHPSHKSYKLKLKFNPGLINLTKFFLSVYTLGFITCGLSSCCLRTYSRYYMNSKILVDLVPLPGKQLHDHDTLTNATNVELQESSTSTAPINVA